MVNPTADDQLAFMFTCLNSAIDGGAKLNYDDIAKAHGLTKNAAYLRLWTLRKKAGYATGSHAPIHDGDKATNKNGKPTKKRGRPVGGGGKAAKAKKVKLEPEEEEEDGVEDDNADVKEDDTEHMEEFITGFLNGDVAGMIKTNEDV